MATVQQIKDAINSANTLGRTNLAEKGVTVDDTATTYQIMQKISELTDAFIITVGYKTGGDRGYSIDKTYAEIYSAAQAGKTIIMIDPVVYTATGLPLILSPHSLNSDGSGTFVTIAEGDDMGGSKDYRYSITVYPDSTVEPRWEELSSELDHTTALKANSSVEIIEPININNNNIFVGSRVVATANAVIKE